MRFVALIGEPATGKTTITKKVLEQLGPWEKIEAPYILAMDFKDSKVIVLGMYDEQIFSGTDRLSMAVEPKMKEWLLSNQENYKDYVVFFEGDRLGTLNFFKWLKENFKDNFFFHVNASDEVKHLRHEKRGDSQTDKFLKGRETKYKNILNSMDGIILMQNDTEEDLKVCYESILSAIKDKESDFSVFRKSKKVGLF